MICFCKQKTAYDLRISDWSSDVCSSDLLADSPELVSVFEVRNGRPQRLQIDRAAGSPGSIEEILWRAFEVVTPANHFVSEQIVDEVSRFEKEIGSASCRERVCQYG